jgi:hypothetical protein
MKSPQYLKPLLGETFQIKDFIYMTVLIVFVNGLSFLVDRNFYLFEPMKAAIFVLLLSDVAGGIYMNHTQSVIDYYDQRPKLIPIFALLHIYPFVMIWLFGVSFWIALGTYLLTAMMTMRTLTLVKMKQVFPWVAIIIFSFVFGLVDEGYSLSYLLFTLLTAVKLLVGFGSHHYMACPVNLKK